jgi:hypothetical protein
VDVGVAGDVALEVVGHFGGELLGVEPGADQEEVVAAGEHGVGVGVMDGAVGRQPHREEGVDLPRQGRHAGKGGLFEAALERCDRGCPRRP